MKFGGMGEREEVGGWINVVQEVQGDGWTAH